MLRMTKLRYTILALFVSVLKTYLYAITIHNHILVFLET